MKKVPKYIVDKMHKTVQMFSKANESMLEIENWLYSKGIDPESLREAHGCGLEEIEYMNDNAIEGIVDIIEQILNTGDYSL